MKKIFYTLIIMMYLASSQVIAQEKQNQESTDKYLTLLTELEPKLTETMEIMSKTIREAFPNPEAYEKTLPPKSKVIENKDQLNFKNYAGLAEAYIFHGKKDQAKDLFLWCQKNYPSVLGNNNCFVPALLGGDFALSYYKNGDLNSAEPLFKQAIKCLETESSPDSYNNLIASYLGLACVYKDRGDNNEAVYWTKKMIELSSQNNANSSQ